MSWKVMVYLNIIQEVKYKWLLLTGGLLQIGQCSLSNTWLLKGLNT